MKRLLDVVISASMLVVLMPLLVIVAILVRLSSRGPILFRQTRVGLGGRDFQLFKFRTMHVQKEASAGSFDAGDDSRVTGLGRFLRTTKIDELPQLWNVLKGEMSIVGPRPEVRKWVDAYSKRWEKIHCVKPGITDPASIAFRNEDNILAAAEDPEEHYRLEVLPQKLDLYDSYLEDQSIWFDINIMVKTAMAVVLGRDKSQ